MILIFGGVYSGKKEYVISKYNIIEKDIFDFNKYIYDNIDNISIITNKYKCLYNINYLIKEMLQKQIDIKVLYDIVDKCIDKDLIFILDDISCGIVPIRSEDRVYREEVSRMLTYLAKKSLEVYRIFAGLPLKIK